MLVNGENGDRGSRFVKSCEIEVLVVNLYVHIISFFVTPILIKLIPDTLHPPVEVSALRDLHPTSFSM